MNLPLKLLTSEIITSTNQPSNRTPKANIKVNTAKIIIRIIALNSANNISHSSIK
nr:MAG TPA: hypothetical protein [Caudoviricetes sp.]